MTHRKLVDTKNLDRYGNPPLPWTRPLGVLDQIPPTELLTWFLGTVRRDGRPHSAGVGGLWHDGDLYFTSGPGTQKSRDLAANPSSSVSVSLDGIDLVFEGTASRVTDRRDPRKGRRPVPGGWMAGRGRRRCVHGPLQRSQRRATAVVPLSTRLRNRVRGRRRRAERRDPLALHGLKLVTASGRHGGHPRRTDSSLGSIISHDRRPISVVPGGCGPSRTTIRVFPASSSSSTRRFDSHGRS